MALSYDALGMGGNCINGPDDGDGDDDRECGGSAPCLLHELDADGRPMDRQQAADVARWRKAERRRLIALRMSMSAELRAQRTQAIARELDGLIAAGAGIVSVYWPIRGEPDLRGWMAHASGLGMRIALPVATALGHPLVFREWQPGAPMARGLWGIPHPARGPDVIPMTVLAPVVGFDAACFRLGYGGGFFDRTLALLQPKARAIGIGYAEQRVATIFPQRHDIPMDCIVTGTSAILKRVG